MVDVARADIIAILTRAPRDGGKTRLFAALGRPVDPALLEALLLDTVSGAATAGLPIVLSVPGGGGGLPGKSGGRMAGVDVIPQPPGDLGDRMRGTMAALFAAGAHRVVLIGSDLPAMTAGPIWSALEQLRRDPSALVIGPAHDGGYYLIAATAVPPVFAGIDWGSDRVLAQTLAAAALAEMPVQLVEPMRDVDTLEDLQMLPEHARRSRAWMEAHGLPAASVRSRTLS